MACDDKTTAWPGPEVPAPAIEKWVELGPELWLVCSLPLAVLQQLRTWVATYPLPLAHGLEAVRSVLQAVDWEFHQSWLLGVQAHLAADRPEQLYASMVLLGGRMHAAASPELWVAEADKDFAFREVREACALCTPTPGQAQILIEELLRMEAYPKIEYAFAGAILTLHQTDPQRVGNHGHVFGLSVDSEVIVPREMAF